MPNLFLQNICTKLPTNFVSNREFCLLTDPGSRPEEFNPETADQWIYSRSGIRTRPYFSLKNVGTGKLDFDFEVELAVSVIRDSCNSEAWKNLSAILTVRSTPYQCIPSISQRALVKLNEHFQTPDKSLFTLDLFQASTGFLAALKVARLLNAPTLILISEILSPLLNLHDPGTAMLFGDAVTAVLFSPEKTPESRFKIMGESFQSKADAHLVLKSDQEPDSFKMKGPELFRRMMPEFKSSSLAILESCKVASEEIQYYLPHQANSRMIERAAHSLKFIPNQVITNIERVGNLSSASTMVALGEAEHENKFKPGSKILINACGAGLSSGAAILEKL